jgi:hypothetical protein
MPNRYLQRVESLVGPKAIALGLTSAGTASLAISLVTLHAPLMAGSLLLLGAGMTLIMRAPEAKSATETRMLLDAGDIEGAETSVVTLLRARPVGLTRGHALLLLGRCAEQRGEFADAKEIYPMAFGSTEGDEDLEEELRERQAFCLAATGGEADAARTLGVDAEKGSPFRVPHGQLRPLGVRAEALVRHHRRDDAGVAELVARHGEELESRLQPRDRALLTVLHRIARSNLGVEMPLLEPVDGRTLSWLVKLIPGAEKQFAQT